MPARVLIFGSDDANTRYATGLSVPDPFIWMRLDHKEFVIVSSLEYARVRQQARRGVKVLLLEDIPLTNVRKPAGRRRNLADVAAAFLRSHNTTEVLVPQNLWAVHLDTLREHGLRVRILSPFFPERLVKTAQEIRHIKQTGLVAKKALRCALDMLKASEIEWNDTLTYKGKRLTSESVRDEIERVFIAHGCQSGETIVSCAEHSALPHHRGSGPLYAGQPIILDIFPRSIATGYFFDLTRTVVKGTPTPELKRLYDTVRRAQQEALSVIAPGKARHVHEAVQDVFTKAGYQTTSEEGFIHSTGHGVGLEIHEEPRISAKSDDALQAGMVVTVEPGLYYKDVGGVRVEDTVLITKDGYINLTNLPKALVIP
jgi:Xaa-Pro aminopeptidase